MWTCTPGPVLCPPICIYFTNMHTYTDAHGLTSTFCACVQHDMGVHAHVHECAPIYHTRTSFPQNNFPSSCLIPYSATHRFKYLNLTLFICFP